MNELRDAVLAALILALAVLLVVLGLYVVSTNEMAFWRWAGMLD